MLENETQRNNDVNIQLNLQEFANLILEAFKGDGLIHSKAADFAKRRGDKRLIVVAAAPRTGSTYLSNILTRASGFPYARLCSAYSTNEHDLYFPGLYIMNQIGCVSQLHMKGTYHNVALLRTFGITPIILVRNIYDIVVSLMSDLRFKETRPGFGSGLNGYSFIWQDESIKNCSNRNLIDAIIDLAIPWYVNFYVSWYRFCQQGTLDAKWVTYENMMADKRQTVIDIMDFVDARIVTPNLDEILDYRAVTFNIGDSNRGNQILTSEQKKRIRHLFSYYPDINFDYYGL